MGRTGELQPKLDTGWAWVIVCATFVSCFMLSGVSRSQGIIIEALVKYYGASTSQVTLVTTLSTLGWTIFSLFGTMLGEVYTRRAVVMFAGIISCLSISLASFGLSVTYIAFTFGAGIGTGNGLIYGNSLAMVGLYFRKRRALANSLALSGASLGQMVLPPFIGLIIEEYSVKGCFLILAGLYLQIVIVGALYRPIMIQLSPETSTDLLVSKSTLDEEEYDYEGRELKISVNSEFGSNFSDFSQIQYTDILRNKIQKEEGLISQIGSSGGSTASKIFFPYASGENFMSASLANLQLISRKAELAFSQIISIESLEEDPRCCSCCSNFPKILDLSVLKNFKCLFFCLVYFFIFFTGMDFALFLPSIVAERGIPSYKSSLLLSIGGAADLVGRLACGAVANYGFCQRYKIVVVCGIAMGINILIFLTAVTYWQMAVQYAISAAVFGAHVALMPIVLIDCMGLEMLPKVLGIVLFCQGLGPTFGQSFLGWLRDQTGGFQIILIIIGVAGVLSGLLLMFYPLVKKMEDKRVGYLRDKTAAQTSTLEISA